MAKLQFALVVSRDMSSKVGFLSHKVADGPSADMPFRPDFVKLLILRDATWSSGSNCVSVPESPPLGLHDTVSVQLHRLLHVKCCALAMFN